MNTQEQGLVRTTTQTHPVTFNFFDPIQFETMQRVCKLYAHSELVPDIYKISETNPDHRARANCMVAIEIAQRIGASPLMIMQNMVPIYGKPSWSSKFLISTVNTCGRFNSLKFKFIDKGIMGEVRYTEYEKIWTTNPNTNKGYYKNTPKVSIFDGSNINDLECIAYTTTKGSDEILESAPISLSLAVKEGWYLKAGSKWQTIPKQMLMYRAASFWTNVYAPELSMGMRTIEEQQDIEDVEFVDVTDKSEPKVDNNTNKTIISMPPQNPTPQPTQEPQPAPTVAQGLQPIGEQPLPPFFE